VDEDDRALHVLPLNHTHGLINVLGCALWSGAVCEMAPALDPAAIWDRFASGDLTLFMAVPTIYRRLVAAWHEAPPDLQRRWAAGAAAMRLFVSGSAALPVSLLDQWRDITGHTLLERYGMTEIGMALSNPLHGVRRPGWVGIPLPGVDVRVVDESGEDVCRWNARRTPGQERRCVPRVLAPSRRNRGGVCRGWVVPHRRRGRVRRRCVPDSRRLSVDIIKTGGEKVSALEVEAVLRDHPDIADCAVVGLPDPSGVNAWPRSWRFGGRRRSRCPASATGRACGCLVRNCRAGSSLCPPCPKRHGESGQAGADPIV